MFYPTNRFWYPLLVLAGLSVLTAGGLYFIPSLRIYYDPARLIILGALSFWMLLGLLEEQDFEKPIEHLSVCCNKAQSCLTTEK